MEMTLLVKYLKPACMCLALRYSKTICASVCAVSSDSVIYCKHFEVVYSNSDTSEYEGLM